MHEAALSAGKTYTSRSDFCETHTCSSPSGCYNMKSSQVTYCTFYECSTDGCRAPKMNEEEFCANANHRCASFLSLPNSQAQCMRAVKTIPSRLCPSHACNRPPCNNPSGSKPSCQMHTCRSKIGMVECDERVLDPPRDAGFCSGHDGIGRVSEECFSLHIIKHLRVQRELT